jgi:hypothetical protein
VVINVLPFAETVGIDPDAEAEPVIRLSFVDRETLAPLRNGGVTMAPLDEISLNVMLVVLYSIEEELRKGALETSPALVEIARLEDITVEELVPPSEDVIPATVSVEFGNPMLEISPAFVEIAMLEPENVVVGPAVPAIDTALLTPVEFKYGALDRSAALVDAAEPVLKIIVLLIEAASVVNIEVPEIVIVEFMNGALEISTVDVDIPVLKGNVSATIPVPLIEDKILVLL